MAAPNIIASTPALSQKQRRLAQRKERRRRKRQAVAQARKCELEADIGEEEEENDEDEAVDEESQRQHEEWLERERLAQEEFRQRREREEAAKKKKEEEEQMIKEEWEAQQRREEEEKEQRLQEKRDREEAVQKRLDEAENQLDNGGPWMNPEAPVAPSSGTERNIANCPFFIKTGACRFGDRCSRKHDYPTSSPTLLIRGMFKTFGMDESRRDDYDMDACLEHSEEELLELFTEFYHDVLPEFKNIGKVVQFKVCCNHEPHLRGNVYVQFDTEELCSEAFMKFNGRWYAGRQLQCEMCPVTRWKSAICGLFDRQKCPKGKNCNFLHVFRNPGNEFWEADRDLQISPDRSARGSRRDEWHSERYGERSWRQRRSSRSPVRSERSHRRWEDDRERRTSHQRGEGTSKSRQSDRRTDRHRSRSRERENKYRDTGSRRDTRERSRSTSREKKRRKQSRERSPKVEAKSLSDGTKTNSHKRSKKSKKSKKKHKKKRHHSDKTHSSTESETEKESEDKTWDNSSIASPSGNLKEEETAEGNHLSSEVKTEATPEIQSELTANGDI
ncbi:PREDICTED: U2 small nuclear ribonucleoprotein auxiliary factor 35 kDa subunit-related protein 2 [Cyprinodon variegatus]|uniref:Zinc finger (CCCH type), RNA-binding motif and serine/arginine rich 2 n=1 Tax=Cyprinodon variegatus TaxID=28743 RepID=A0A3Q2DGL9_CYPVA|nr:PREDICTED: U2 small nuclear ribonucleoprotein auxiliary factor 35 kDa subunit-related protein 2 [Cyprinodon variegatus]